MGYVILEMKETMSFVLTRGLRHSLHLISRNERSSGMAIDRIASRGLDGDYFRQLC